MGLMNKNGDLIRPPTPEKFLPFPTWQHSTKKHHLQKRQAGRSFETGSLATQPSDFRATIVCCLYYICSHVLVIETQTV